MGVERWLVRVGVRVGTLLGPEASGPVSSAARVRGPSGLWPGVVGGWVCVSGWFLLCLVGPLCGVGGGLVGLLFEICIVDASIN